jgi:hypothetical protein
LNRTVTHLAEKSLELALFSAKNLKTPNPFRPLHGKAPWFASAHPEDFYALPASPPGLTFQRAWAGSERTRMRFTFPSFVQTPYSENNTVYGLASFAPRKKTRAALVVVHGHRMRSFAMLEWIAIPAARLGIDMYYLTLPFHMQRAPAETWSGQLSLNSSVEGTALAFRQGVIDLRALMAWIAAERGTPVGLVGMSLGAFTCSMATVVDPHAAALVSILGGGSLAQIHWDGYQMGRPRRQLMQGGVTRQKLEQYWAVLGPAYWKSRLPGERVLMLAGKYDPIVTPQNVSRMWQAWDHPVLRWYPCGHSTIVWYYREVVREIVRFLSSSLLI